MDYSGFRRSANIEDVRGQRLDPLSSLMLGVPTPIEAIRGAALDGQRRFGQYDNDIQNFADKNAGPQFGVSEPMDRNKALMSLIYAGQR